MLPVSDVIKFLIVIVEPNMEDAVKLDAIRLVPNREDAVKLDAIRIDAARLDPNSEDTVKLDAARLDPNSEDTIILDPNSDDTVNVEFTVMLDTVIALPTIVENCIILVEIAFVDSVDVVVVDTLRICTLIFVPDIVKNDIFVAVN